MCISRPCEAHPYSLRPGADSLDARWSSRIYFFIFAALMLGQCADSESTLVSAKAMRGLKEARSDPPHLRGPRHAISQQLVDSAISDIPEASTLEPVYGEAPSICKASITFSWSVCKIYYNNCAAGLHPQWFSYLGTCHCKCCNANETMCS